MTQHGPIYQMVEQEINRLSQQGDTIHYTCGQKYSLTKILPKIDELEQSQLKAHSDTMKECGEELDKYRWIPVEERLPEIGTDVLVLTGHFHYDAWLSRSGNWVINNTFHTEETYANGVTHWMPLPNPPTNA